MDENNGSGVVAISAHQIAAMMLRTSLISGFVVAMVRDNLRDLKHEELGTIFLRACELAEDVERAAKETHS